MAKDIYVARPKAKFPVAAQAHKKLLEHFGLTGADLESAHTEKAWRWKVITAEGRKKIAAKSRKSTPAKAPADEKPAKPAGGGKKGGTRKKAQASASSSASAANDEPRRAKGGLVLPEQIFEGGGQGYLVFIGGRGRRATQVKYFRTVSEMKAQAKDQAANRTKGCVVAVQVLAAGQE